MKFKVTTKETQLGKALKRLHSEGNVSFKVGVFGSDDSKMVKIAATHEFGAEIKVKENRFVPKLGRIVKQGTIIKIPARRWLSLAFIRNEKFYKELVKTNLKKIAEGKMSIEKSNDIIAITLASRTKAELGKDMPPPLKYRNGTPLVDNGDLRRSIGTKIVTSKGVSETKKYGDDQ